MQTKFNIKRIAAISLLLVVIALPYVAMAYLTEWYRDKVSQIDNAAFVIIDKQTMQLSVYRYNGEMACQFPIACGLNYGDKRQEGDMRTPEGVFSIVSIEDASEWKHDFKDGKGEIEGAYGPNFVRLEVPGVKGIGIHGTHLPESIGTRASEGCIRLNNEDLLELLPFLYIGMRVVITPSDQDALANQALDNEEASTQNNGPRL